ncbi:hypothetical protein [Ruminococcus sp.]|uniref:hypothetical protein n=1 Tax=Ruminococcus sp. TaxID=41978 RepID=UPI00386984D3
MKCRFRKLIAFILVIILGAAAAVTGFAVSAASGTTVTDRASTEKGSGVTRSSLRDGIWQVLYKTGVTKLLAINSQARTMTLIEPDTSADKTVSFDYTEELELYKLRSEQADAALNRRVIENNGNTAAVSDENGDIISLFYLDSTAQEDFHYYNLNQLSDMARLCFEKEYGNSKGISFSSTMNADGSFFATINGMKGDQKEITYTVDMQTGRGTDSHYETVDLSKYAK